MSEPFKRCTPFSEKETAILIDILNNHIDAIECKKRDNANLAKKVKAWQVVCEEFNSNPCVRKRSDIQLKRFWENKKAKDKRDLAMMKREQMLMGFSRAKLTSNAELMLWSTTNGASLMMDSGLAGMAASTPLASYTSTFNSHSPPSTLGIGEPAMSYMFEPDSTEIAADMQNRNHTEEREVHGGRNRHTSPPHKHRRVEADREEELHQLKVREALARAAAAEAEQKAAEDAVLWAIEEREIQVKRAEELHKLSIQHLQLQIELLQKQLEQR